MVHMGMLRRYLEGQAPPMLNFQQLTLFSAKPAERNLA